MLLGFLDRGGIGQWAYAMAADVASQGCQFIRFTSDDVDFKTRTILAETWSNGAWKQIRTRYPDAIRNFELQKGLDKILEQVPYSLGPVVRKDDHIALLSRHPLVKDYIPQTIAVHNADEIIKLLNNWQVGLLKPARGRLGQGIILVKKHQDGFELNENAENKILTENEFRIFIQELLLKGDYILQQFAAGVGPANRYFNIRVVVSKSKDGDWHASNYPMSLLALPNMIVANRDVGSKNIDLESFLRFYYKDEFDALFDHLIRVSVDITRILDDMTNGTAEEIALDMAIDDSGHLWLHEANWRGGLWLFEDDIGIYRHGGANLKRLALKGRENDYIGKKEALSLIVNARESLEEYWQREENIHLENNTIFGVNLPRFTDETLPLIAQSLGMGLPIIATSSLSSFRKVQRILGEAFELLQEQTTQTVLPKVLVRSGALGFNPLDGRGYQQWFLDEYIRPEVVDELDMENGYCSSVVFIEESIKEHLKDLKVNGLDVFILEGLSQSLYSRSNWKDRWTSIVQLMQTKMDNNQIVSWGIEVELNSLSTTKAMVKSLYSQSHLLGNAFTFVGINIGEESIYEDFKAFCTFVEKLPVTLVVSIASLNVKKKAWDEAYSAVNRALLEKIKKDVSKGSIVLSSVERKKDVLELLNTLHQKEFKDFTHKQMLKSDGTPWVIGNEKRRNILGRDWMKTNQQQPHEQIESFHRRMEGLRQFASFDHRQIFRFFVDGRFHKKYRGWVGYEANEQGSVAGMLNAYCYLLDNFDISAGLQPSYIRNLHALIMKNVITDNPKSTPGDMRFLEAGLSIYASNSTLESVQELLDLRRGDGTAFFHARGFQKPADEFTAEDILELLQEKRRIRYRNWYPELTIEQKNALNNPGDLTKYYEVKHFIQRCFAQKMDAIVHEYNEEIKHVQTEDDIFIAISRIARNLEILHPFPDGNGRAFIACLMNHLLMFNGISPAILDDPNIDIDLSVKEFALEIKKGVENTKVLLENPEAVLFDYSITEAQPNEIHSFDLISKELVSRLSVYANSDFSDLVFHSTHPKTVYLYLTPQRIEKVSKGKWLNIKAQDLSKIRFENIEVKEQVSSNQLYFFRNFRTWAAGKNDEEIISYIQNLASNGVIALVVDDIAIARKSPLPTLYVEDIDDALARVARAARNEINCKAVAFVGTHGKSFCKASLSYILEEEVSTHFLKSSDNKTADIMASLSNLRLTDTIELNEVDVGYRPNPVSYRSRSIRPNICFISSFESDDAADSKALKSMLDTYAAMADGIQEGGLFIINSDNKFLDEMMNAIVDRKAVAIQTFGEQNEDMARLINATYHKDSSSWSVEADILGEVVKYQLYAFSKTEVIMSLGLLLTVTNLGYNLTKVLKQLENLHLNNEIRALLANNRGEL